MLHRWPISRVRRQEGLVIGAALRTHAGAAQAPFPPTLLLDQRRASVLSSVTGDPVRRHMWTCRIDSASASLHASLRAAGLGCASLDPEPPALAELDRHH
jgi:hypothetical protein